MQYWAKDHWSTLAYLETRCVDHKGKIDIRNMRCNISRYPHYDHLGRPWNSDWATRLQQDAPKETVDSAREHCDWDCVEDFLREGLVQWVDKKTPTVKFTNKGFNVVYLVRRHKCNGGNFGEFKWNSKKQPS